MITLLVLLTFARPSLAQNTPGRNGPTVAETSAAAGVFFDRLTACYKIRDDERELQCLLKVSTDVVPFYEAFLNKWYARVVPKLSAAQIETLGRVNSGLMGYATPHCQFEAGLSAVTRMSMGRQFAMCIVTTFSQSANAMATYANGMVYTTLGGRNVRPDVEANVEHLKSRALNCLKVPPAEARERCAADTFAATKAYVGTSRARLMGLLAGKPNGPQLVQLHDEAQGHWFAYRNDFCQTMADQEADGRLKELFQYTCLTLHSLSRMRILFSNL